LNPRPSYSGAPLVDDEYKQQCPQKSWQADTGQCTNWRNDVPPKVIKVWPQKNKKSKKQ
jgi:hypothetical protein